MKHARHFDPGPESALQSEIRVAVEAATKPLRADLARLAQLVEESAAPDPGELVTVAQAAEILKCSTRTIHRLCDEGKLAVAQRKGRKKLLRRADLIKAPG